MVTHIRFQNKSSLPSSKVRAVLYRQYEKLQVKVKIDLESHTEHLKSQSMCVYQDLAVDMWRERIPWYSW